MRVKILFMSWAVPPTAAVASIRKRTRTETGRSDNFSRRKSGCIVAAARGFKVGAEMELFIWPQIATLEPPKRYKRRKRALLFSRH
ncbi:hypothetical protein B0H13DRAFT_2057385 [Mycena leptocephala]|nr:hypothetical protein B0H13DRAFT_2058304 [Mycena leptocephala]KAJ7874611.1 hypothetical protein B0H13DRAFT_2057385 [Mycena leptocephala]